MTDAFTEQDGRSPAELLTRLSAAGRKTDGREVTADDWAAVRERAEANLSPAELAATREAILDDVRKRGLPSVAQDAAERTLRFCEPPRTDG